MTIQGYTKLPVNIQLSDSNLGPERTTNKYTVLKLRLGRTEEF